MEGRKIIKVKRRLQPGVTPNVNSNDQGIPQNEEDKEPSSSQSQLRASVEPPSLIASLQHQLPSSLQIKDDNSASFKNVDSQADLELKARLEKLERENETLRTKLDHQKTSFERSLKSEQDAKTKHWNLFRSFLVDLMSHTQKIIQQSEDSQTLVPSNALSKPSTSNLNSPKKFTLPKNYEDMSFTDSVNILKQQLGFLSSTIESLSKQIHDLHEKDQFNNASKDLNILIESITNPTKLKSLTLEQLQDLSVRQREHLMLIDKEIELNLQQMKEEKTCVVCMDGEKEMACIPCGHMALCSKCSTGAHGKMLRSCPICRAPVKLLQRVYL